MNKALTVDYPRLVINDLNNPRLTLFFKELFHKKSFREMQTYRSQQLFDRRVLRDLRLHLVFIIRYHGNSKTYYATDNRRSYKKRM